MIQSQTLELAEYKMQTITKNNKTKPKKLKLMLNASNKLIDKNNS
jgi:hypothetical protein